MAAKAKCAKKRTREAQKKVDEQMEKALAAYLLEQEKTEGKKKGLRTICRDIENTYFVENRQQIHLDHNKLHRLTKGGMMLAQSNAKKAHLLPEESTKLLEFVLELAERGFPLTHKNLAIYVNDILQARLGDDFEGVGKQWTYRWVERHSDQLGMYWSRHLDTARGRAVNPATNAKWFELLGETLQGIDGTCIWGTDECGFMPGRGSAVKVIGPAGAHIQHRQRSGNRETITVVPFISAAGESIPPAVIYKSQGYLVNWLQNNPLKASIGYSKSGFSNRIMGVQLIQHFDKHTSLQAAGRARVLLLDGHNSHYSKEFLQYAREHQIHILCYPSHATHVYQGLDVICFSPLKHYWTEERDEWEMLTGQPVTKQNFLEIYGKAHIRAFTPELIRKAFEHTGVYPFNPRAIPEKLLAPSLETSKNAALPLVQPSPVKAIARLIHDVADNALAQDPLSNSNRPASNINPDPVLLAAHTAVKALSNTSGSFLVASAPIRSKHPVPKLPAAPLSPPCLSKHHLLYVEARTPLEQELQKILHDAAKREVQRHGVLAGMQATLVLQGRYCDIARKQLAHQEKKKKKRSAAKLRDNGLPVLLSSDEFYEKVTEHEQAKREKERQKHNRTRAREWLAEAVAAWEIKEAQRKVLNEELTRKHREAVDIWTAEKEDAKREGRKSKAGRKPLRGPLHPASPKPTMAGAEAAIADFAWEDVSDEGDESEDDADDVDDDSE